MTNSLHHSDDCFEAVCNNWENKLKTFIDELSNGHISTLKNVQWKYEKKRINVYPPDENNKKQRGAQGPHYKTTAKVNHSAAEAIWKDFKKIAQAEGLNRIERLRNNEKELGWFEFKAINCNNNDRLSCKIYLPSEWRVAEVRIDMFIGPRYLKSQGDL